jgi:hypothetical protein
MEELTIKKIDGRWTVNGKTFNELKLNERNALAGFIKDFEFCYTVIEE